MPEAALNEQNIETDSSHLARLLVWLTAGLTLIGLIVLWPYQHWQFANRSSLLLGIAKKIQQDPEWWYCLVAPVIVGWLVWNDHGKLKKLPLSGSWWGAPIVAVGMAFFWFGYKVDTAYPGYVAGQLIPLGLILLLGGREWLRRLLFPWAFLIFMWPMVPLEARLSVPLRSITTHASAMVLNGIGVHVVREGTGLYSAADAAQGLAQGALFQLDVDQPCSGIRSLFALMMIGALYGYLALKNWLPRSLLFLSAIPLAMLGNLVRMVFLALGSIWFGVGVAVGNNVEGHQEMSTFHLMAGLIVFAVALACMFLLVKLMEKWDRKRAKLAVRPRQRAGAASARATWIHLSAAVAIVGGGAIVCASTDIAYRVGAPGIRLELPAALGGFVSTDQPMSAREQSVLNEDVRIERRFYTTAQRAVLASLVLSGAEKRSLHSPEICLPSQGWIMGGQQIIPVDLGNGRQAQATLLTLYRDVELPDGRRSRIRALNIYWYQGSDETTCATYDEHVSRTYLDAVFRNVNHRWALISFFTPLKAEPEGQMDPYAEIAALEDTKAFIRELMPRVLTF